MPEENRNAHTREEIAHRIFDRLATMALREWPGLSDGQRRGIVDHIYGVVGAWSPQASDSEYTAQFFLAERNEALKEFFRPTPTPHETEVAVARAKGITEPAARVTLHREVNKMTADERLAATVGVDMSNLPPATTPAATAVGADATADERRRGVYCEADRVLEQRGYDLRQMLPLRRRELHLLVQKETAPKDTPSINAVKGKLALGKAWADIAPSVRVDAEREAKAVYGKSLRELGLLGGV